MKKTGSLLILLVSYLFSQNTYGFLDSTKTCGQPNNIDTQLDIIKHVLIEKKTLLHESTTNNGKLLNELSNPDTPERNTIRTLNSLNQGCLDCTSDIHKNNTNRGLKLYQNILKIKAINFLIEEHTNELAKRSCNSEPNYRNNYTTSDCTRKKNKIKSDLRKASLVKTLLLINDPILKFEKKYKITEVKIRTKAVAKRILYNPPQVVSERTYRELYNGTKVVQIEAARILGKVKNNISYIYKYLNNKQNNTYKKNIERLMNDKTILSWTANAIDSEIVSNKILVNNRNKNSDTYHTNACILKNKSLDEIAKDEIYSYAKTIGFTLLGLGTAKVISSLKNPNFFKAFVITSVPDTAFYSSNLNAINEIEKKCQSDTITQENQSQDEYTNCIETTTKERLVNTTLAIAGIKTSSVLPGIKYLKKTRTRVHHAPAVPAGPATIEEGLTLRKSYSSKDKIPKEINNHHTFKQLTQKCNETPIKCHLEAAAITQAIKDGKLKNGATIIRGKANGKCDFIVKKKCVDIKTFQVFADSATNYKIRKVKKNSKRKQKPRLTKEQQIQTSLEQNINSITRKLKAKKDVIIIADVSFIPKKYLDIILANLTRPQKRRIHFVRQEGLKKNNTY